MKIWAKIRKVGNQEFYHSHNISQAVHGFREMGAEIVNYETIDEIYQWVTQDDIVLDYIDQCLTIFDKFNKHPHLEDYPEVLKPYLGRKTWNDTIDHINTDPSTWGVFVKPTKEKAFTGKIINGPADLVGCGSCYENYNVLCSEVLDIKREWRGFVYYDKLIDIRPYHGDWHYNYDPETIDEIMKAFVAWEDRPVACSIDFAVVMKNHTISEFKHNKEGKMYRIGSHQEPCEETIFLEANDAYALGNYGLDPLLYAKLISARWSQILDRPDEFNFTA
jgi:hypothetical protein